MRLDDHGQPLIGAFNAARRTERDVSELLGLAKGVLADGEVSQAEATLVKTWIEQHLEAVATWPMNRLAQRLETIYADGHADPEECRDLRDLLTSLVGGNAGIIGVTDAATDFPIDQPPPPIVWPGSVFVFTGQMAFGPRRECQRHVKLAGGLCDGDISRGTNYLVIGTFGSRDWVHTSFGRKIEKAVQYRESGYGIVIVNEDHWASELPAHVAGGKVVWNA